MYDEFERAVTGRSREGLSLLGWLSIALGTLFALGLVGAGLTVYYVRANVGRLAEQVAVQLQRGPAEAAAAVVHRLESHADLLSATPDEGVALLESLDPGAPSDAFMRDLFGESLEIFSQDEGLRLDLGRSQEKGGILELHSGQKDVRVDLRRSDRGGSLVIDSDEGRVRFDLVKTDDGGFLAIDSDEGQVRFDLIRGEDGGSLIIRSPEGEVRFDVRGSEDGGTLVVRSGDEVLRFGAGSEAERMPGWVARAPGMPSDPQRVYSLLSARGRMGAVAWEGDGSPQEILDFYRGWLEEEGFELRYTQQRRNAGEEQTSLWARNETTRRIVFLVAEHENGSGPTRVLLGYGEAMGPRTGEI